MSGRRNVLYSSASNLYGLKLLTPPPSRPHPRSSVSCRSCPLVMVRYYLLPDNLNLDTLLVEDAPKHKMGKVPCVFVFESLCVYIRAGARTHFLRTYPTMFTRVLVLVYA